MAAENRRNWWIFTGGLVALSVVFAVVATLALQPEDTNTPPRPTPEPTSGAGPVQSQLPRVPRDPPPHPAPTLEAPKPVEKTPGPACSQASDCRGPKTADCIAATCEAGHCVFDRSSCECVDDSECDDGLECTRDLCFARTRKCIHIRSACE